MNSQQQASSAPAKDFPVVTGSLLSSSSSNYQVQSFLGEGTFGKVAKCMKTATNEMVAVKIFKNHEYSMRDAQDEVAILTKLRALDPDTCNIVRWNDFFIHAECMCLDFELLDMSLADFMKQRMRQPLPLKDIRPILQQLATALKHLKTMRIIHADLKPENIMLVDHRRQPLKVKIIDFGLACDVSAARPCSYIQTRWYRSPEIMLGLRFSEAIDMWSLGQVAATLFLGTPLYPGSCEYDMIRFIVETQGQPPDDLLNLGWKTRCYFQRKTNSTGQLWKLMKPKEVRKIGIQSKETRRNKFRSLDDFEQFNLPFHVSAANNTAEFRDRQKFVDLLKQMLHLDARNRITPSELLKHPFISMCHLVDIFHQSTHASSCFNKMGICQRESLTSGSGKVGSASTQQPSLHQQASSSTAHNAQQRVLPKVQPAGKSHLAQPHHQGTDPRPSTATQTQSQRSVVKRKRAEPGATETSNKSSEKQKKRGRIECGVDRHRNTKASLPTTSTTQAASRNSGPPKGEPSRTDEGTVQQRKRKRPAESLDPKSTKRSAPYIDPKKAANQGPCQETVAPSSSMAQADANTTTSQTRTLSPTTLKWCTAFAPERVACYKAAGQK